MKGSQSAGIVFAALVFVALPIAAHGQAIEKKLIQYGWDLRRPAYIAEHIREMEKKPFDGIMTLANFSHVFWMKDAGRAYVDEQRKLLESVKWEKFTDNFFMMYARSNMDWFSDEDWGPDGLVLRNVGYCAEVAKAGGLVGICFDMEPFWGRNPWGYADQPRADEKSFAEFEQVIRKRGAQFVNRIEEEFPNPVIHTFFLVSYFNEAALEPDPAKRDEILKGEFYGLVPAFVNGMVEAADPGTIITDGNEHSYYYKEPLDYYEAYHEIQQLSQQLIPPELRAKYRAHVQCAQALFLDVLIDTFRVRTPSTYMTPEERARFVEHNVYWALKTSDRYVWFYSEYTNWWTGGRIPPYLEKAVESARTKVAKGEPLGFEIGDFWQRAQDKLVALLEGPVDTKTAKVRRLAKDKPVPVIDGQLDEAVWKEGAELGPFVSYLYAPNYDLEGKTRAWMTFDESNLYVAFRCEEPAMDRLPGSDRVEVQVAPAEEGKLLKRIAVNAGDESAVHKGEGYWSVEMAIPWASLDMSVPKPGEKLAGNLTRRRAGGRYGEFSTWSPNVYSRERERKNFGTWIFE